MQIHTIRPGDAEDGPFSIEAEQQLLGALLNNNDRLADVADIVRPDDFYEPLHGRIYQIIADRVAKAHLASPVVLASVMAADEGVIALGGGGYFARLSAGAMSSYAVRDYAGMIATDAIRRKMARQAQEAATALRRGGDPAEVANMLLGAVQSMPDGEKVSSVSLLRAMTSAISETHALRQGSTKMLKTGIPALDGIIRGLLPGDMTVLAGSTSMGKTSVALEITANAAKSQPVLFVSLEMTPEQLVRRLVSTRAEVAYEALRDPERVDDTDYERFIRCAQDVAQDLRLRIAPKHVRDTAAIYAAATKARLDMGGLGLVVVDYAGLVRAPGNGRYEQMTNVSVGLKNLALVLGVPILVLAQINREHANRDDKRPQLSDLKESGQFENDADQVVMCHREEYWLERQGPKPGKSGGISADAIADHEVELSKARNKMELIVRKNRHGKIGTAITGFHAPTNKFWRLKD